HSQTIDPTTNLTANVNFLSGKNYYNTSTNNLNDLLRQNALSNITLSKVWEGTPNSLSINYSRDQNLISGEVRQVIPSVNFTRSQSFPFRTKNTSLLDLKWYETVSYTYNSQLLYRDEKVLTNPSVLDRNFIKNSRGGVRQSISISAPLKISEFSISPFLNYNEVWYNKYITKEFNPSDSSVIVKDIKGFRAFRFFNTGISINTRLIGIFNTRFLGILGLRHIITPQITYSYQPDFSKPKWNAYGSYKNQFGQDVKYSFYEREVFGGAPSGEQQAINFSVGNVFEMKVRESDTTDKKFQLLNLNATVGYNFAADSLKFSEIGVGYRTQIGNFLNIGGGASFNLYKYVQGTGRINKFLLSEEKRLAQLTSFNISLSTSLQGGDLSTDSKDTTYSEYTDETEYIGIYGDRPADFSIPWNISLNYNYGLNRQNPFDVRKFSTISGNLGFNLTPKWKFTFSTGYDLVGREFTTPYVTIYRDLHCWEMSFNWIPGGLYRGYRFELRIKAPQLHDVKVTKQSNYRGVY
ncbi:MAG: putative LPS assembly protein LptD, partial [Ignavibacteria bacterium]|nr:putative LPS assembly protein LptD [Ignavibacteria bacterium]